MARSTGPGKNSLIVLEIMPTTSPAEGPSQVINDIRDGAIQFDGAGGAAVTGAVQVQISIGGDEWIDDGAVVNTWPARRELTKYATHVRLKTTVNISAGAPQALLGGFRD